MRKTFEHVSPADKVEKAVKALRARAENSSNVERALRSSAERVADWITQGGLWFGETHEERDAQRLAHLKKWKRKPGQVLVYDTTGRPVRVYEATGRDPVQKEAWAVEAINRAWEMIKTNPLKWGMDKVEFSARAVPGIKQGTRLSKEQVAEIRAKFGDDQFAFRVQTLLRYRQTPTLEGLLAFAEWADSKLDLRMPVVTSEPVDKLDVEDDREATSAHDIFTSSEGRSRWHYLYLDGEITGTPVLTWKEEAGGIDDEFDRGGYRRREDLYSPVTRAEYAKAKAEAIARTQQVLEKSRRRCSGEATPEEREEFQRYMANIHKAKPEVDEARSRRNSPTLVDGKVYVFQDGKMRLVSAQEAAEQSRQRYEAILERRRRPYQPPQYPGYTVKQVGRLAGENASAFKDDEIEEELVNERDARTSAKAEERAIKSAMEQSRADYERTRRLADDFVEVLANQAKDVPQSDLELLEESLSFFLTGEDPDDDLDLDKAMSAVPELAEHVAQSRARRSSNAPKGLIGAIAQERTKKGDRLNATLFLRGLAALEAAANAADLEAAHSKEE